MVTLRPAGPADEPAIHRLTEELAAFPIPPWRTREEITRADHVMLGEALRGQDTNAALLIAENEAGTAIGVLFVSTRRDYFTGRPHAHVEVVAVAPAAQGQGLGRRLMQAAEVWARDQGYGSITLNVFAGNARALALYQRLGYAAETIHCWKAL